MFNQIRAEFYKLFHTKALYLTFALILAVFGIFSIGGQQQICGIKFKFRRNMENRRNCWISCSCL